MYCDVIPSNARIPHFLCRFHIIIFSCVSHTYVRQFYAIAQDCRRKICYTYWQPGYGSDK